jgi:hypothetical protein
MPHLMRLHWPCYLRLLTRQVNRVVNAGRVRERATDIVIERNAYQIKTPLLPGQGAAICMPAGPGRRMADV